MITIFSNPRPFLGPFDELQRNAILSWTKLLPKCEIILFEDEEGTTLKVAKELGLKCISGIATNEFGTPLLPDIFSKIRKEANNEIISQVNADIILMDDFVEGILRMKKEIKNKPFFMSGRRWDYDLYSKIDFENIKWSEELKSKVLKSGKLHGFSGMDYWVFPKNFDFNPPEFVIGRPGMDSWLVYKARKMKIPVIDATDSIFIVHQNHNYPKKKSEFFKLEIERNKKIDNVFINGLTLRDADRILDKKGIKRPSLFRLIFSMFSLFCPLRFLIYLKRKRKF